MISSAYRFLFILLLLISSQSCVCNRLYFGQPTKLTCINIIDRNGLTETINTPERLNLYENVNFLEPQPYQKVLRVYARDLNGCIKSFITSYYENGLVKQYLEVVNNRACGKYKEWHQNGVMKLEAMIIGGTADIVGGAEKTWLFDGCSNVWNDRGCLEAAIPYVKGELEGISTYYHSNGNVWKTISFHKNRADGMLEIFMENGQALQSTQYSNGVKNGPSYRHWDGGSISTEEVYCEGLLSSGRYYNTKGECISEVNAGTGFRAVFGKDMLCELHEYHEGTLDGLVKVFNKNQRLASTYHSKNGTKHGEEIFYYDIPRLNRDPPPKISISWYEGKIQGVAKTWYDNGVQESQREMSNNAKNGHSSAWYKDGSLMLIEEYSNDKLVRGEYFVKDEKYPISEVREGNGIATIYDPEGSFVHKIIYVNGKPQIEN